MLLADEADQCTFKKDDALAEQSVCQDRVRVIEHHLQGLRYKGASITTGIRQWLPSIIKSYFSILNESYISNINLNFFNIEGNHSGKQSVMGAQSK